MVIPPLLDAWYLTGPTAAGKTAVGVELARRLDAEVVSLDSMAIYRGLDIGTAKPTVAERQSIPHHLLDIVPPDEEFSLAEYVAQAHEIARDVTSRGRRVLFVGGTPLYLKSLLRGVFVGPAADWDRRRHWQEFAAQEGPAALHDRLRAVDPLAAERLHPRDQRRIIRALEVFEQTGRPISEFQQQFATPQPPGTVRVFVLDWPREDLARRIDERVDAMFAQGLIGEVQSLMAAGVTFSRTAGQAVGYREVLEHLAGERPLAETIALVKTRTRQFAKRQGTWFRSLAECRFVPLAEPVDVAEVVPEIVRQGMPV